MLTSRAAVALLAIAALTCAPHALAARKHKPAKAAVVLPKGPLPSQVAQILSEPAAQGCAWGISVTALDGAPLFALHDDVRMAPASNTKLFTTAAAFALLPQDLTLPTRVIAHGAISGGVLRGDIVLQGNGDPSMSARVLPYLGHTVRDGDPLAALDALAAQVAAAGVRQVTGNVIGDDSAFVYQPYPTGWAWDDLQWEEGAPVSALTVNDNVVYLSLSAASTAGEPALASWLPLTAYYTIENSVRTVAAAPGIRPAIGVERQPGSRVVRVWGTMPMGSKSVGFAIALDDPAAFAAEAFRERLLAHGVQIGGTAQPYHQMKNAIAAQPDVPSSATDAAAAATPQIPETPEVAEPAQPQQQIAGSVLAQRVSPPLAQDLVVTNKVSQNLHAELLLMQIARLQAPNAAALRSAGLLAETRVFAQAGVLPGDVLLRDGSGVSAENMVTARSVTTLLRFAAAQTWGAQFRATLPVGGVDGTLNARFTQPPLRGQVQAKTGTLAESADLSGYITARSGRTVAFSILCDRHLPDAAARQTVDKLVAAIYAAE